MHISPCNQTLGWLWFGIGLWLTAGMAAPAAASPAHQPTQTTETIMRPVTQPAASVAAIPPIDTTAPPTVATASFGLG